MNDFIPPNLREKKDADRMMKKDADCLPHQNYSTTNQGIQCQKDAAIVKGL